MHKHVWQKQILRQTRILPSPLTLFLQSGTSFKKFLNYFNDANKEKKNKKFDFSIIGGPHYSSDTKLGLGLVAAGLYRSDRNDTILPPSNVSLYGDISTVGFYLLGIRGTHLFPHDRYRLNYNLYFYSFPSLYWGTGMTTEPTAIMKATMTVFRHK